jgi:hypothetical protein
MAPGMLWLAKSRQNPPIEHSAAGEQAPWFEAALAAASSAAPDLVLTPPSQQHRSRLQRGRTLKRSVAFVACTSLLVLLSTSILLGARAAAAEREYATIASRAQVALALRRDLDQATDALALLTAEARLRPRTFCAH